MFECLTDSNFIMYAMKHYDNPQCKSKEEFFNDLHHLKYIKRLFRRYAKTGKMESLQPRLALNHLIILYNVFNVEATTRILFLKLEPSLWSTLKTFLVFLSSIPDTIHGINNTDIDSISIPIDMELSRELRKL